MNNFLKKSVLALSLAVLPGIAPMATAQDAADMPVIMTLKSNIFGYQGPENSFSIFLGSTEKDCEFFVSGPKTQEYIWVDPYSVGTDPSGEKTPLATEVHLSVTETDNTVEIRGDASKLDYIDVHGCYLGSIELSSALVNLSVIDVSHNELKEIDLSPFKNLGSIDLLDNAFTDPAKMKIGTDHPSLIILSVGINDVIDPELELKNFPNLQYFSARNNYGVTHVDPSQNPNLVSLVLEVTNITSLDVSKNVNLDVLNISNTKINSIDLSKNVNLGEFYASHEGSYNVRDEYKFSTIDVSKNTKLQYLDLSGNKLSSIDLTNNPQLLLLYLQKNQLSEIDLSKNTRLSSVNLSNNLFTFATLPLPGDGWDYYYYRQPMACNFKYKVGEPIDFSNEVIRAPYQDAQGNIINPQTYATVFAVPRAADPYEIDESLYTYKDGVITFKKALEDSVYIDFYCTAFPDWTIQSAQFKVKTEEDFDAPTSLFTFTPAASMAGKTVGLKLGGAPMAAGLNYPADITVRSGEYATLLTGVLTQSQMPTSENVTFTLPATAAPVEILVSDGFGATNLAINGIEMTSIDLSPSENILNLAITNAALPAIDLGYNRSLIYLDLSYNNLTYVDLAGVRGDYEKWDLASVNLSNNRLTRFSTVIYDAFNDLDFSNNNFSDFDFRYYSGIKSLNMSNNKLSGIIDMSTVEAIESLDMSGNSISAIEIASWAKIKDLNVQNNNMSFATLPLIAASNVSYTYAPQNVFSILAGGAAVNLSAQNINGNTTFVWKYADTKAEVERSSYTLENGVTRFSDALSGKKVYCEMTNPTFPQFDNDPLTTSELLVLDKPSNLVGSFTTTQSGEALVGFRFNKSGANAIYIDWNGDGSQYDEYVYDDRNTQIYRSGTSIAGRTAKIYTYGSPEDVSCFFALNVKMKDIDLTPMTKAEAIDIHSAGLTDGSIKLPRSSSMFELVLDGNSFEKESFEIFTNLSTINLAGNKYTEFDLSSYPQAMFVDLGNNRLENVKFGNNEMLYQLNLTGNLISNIDLTGLSGLGELLIPDNQLSNIDVSPVKNRLQALNIAGNNFTFETLPRFEEFNPYYFYTYYYSNQHPVQVVCQEGKIDLSAQAKVGDIETVYRWFLGDRQDEVYYDYNYEMFVGEELEGPDVSQDPEYVIENGVTYFRYTQKRRVICAMTNESYPDLILYTAPTGIDRASGVENIEVGTENGPVDVYTLSGIRIRTGVEPSEALKDLAPGLYIVGNKKVLVK